MTSEEFKKYIVPYLDSEGFLSPWEVGKENPYHQCSSYTESCTESSPLIVESIRIWKDIYLFPETEENDMFFWSPKNVGEEAIYKAYDLYKLKKCFKS